MLPPAVDAAPLPSDPLALQKPLEQFRANTKRLAIHPTEKILLWIVTFHLCALPWALGGMRPWSQIPGFILAALGFVVALLPRNYTEEHTGANRFRLMMWPKLLRFPLFWLGLALLALVTVQIYNPAWEYRTDGKVWWMRKIEFIDWLPAGVEAPFERWGPQRMLMIYATVWLTVCSLWVGFTRRRTLQQFLIALAVNGSLLALFGIAQRMLSNGKMFWSWKSPNDAFFASFIYKNHGGSYLCLTLALTCGLAGWYYLRGQRRLEKSNPSGLFVFFATCTAVAILVSYARGATLVMLGFLCLTIGAFVVNQLRSNNENRRPVVMIVLVLIFGFFLKTGLEALNTHEAWTRLKQGMTNEDLSLEVRRMATRATLDMLPDHGQMGAGAGSFRFLFPAYQQRYPQIFAIGGNRMVWDHAHNDIAQTAVEFGLPGAILFLGFAGYFTVALVRAYFWGNPVSSCLVLAVLLLTIYSWWDFPLQNPSVLGLAMTFLVAAVMWARFEETGAKG